MILHGYFRSTAAYRVRIVLNLKGLKAEQISRHLRKGEQRTPDYLELNPQGLLPTLILDDGEVLTQSLAIIEYLDMLYPEPALVPSDPLRRARVQAFVLSIACDIHPVQNLRVLQALRAGGFSEEQMNAWAADVNAQGLAACEKLLSKEHSTFCFGEEPSLADVCLIPQMGNARRFGVDVAKLFPKLTAIEQAALKLPAFANASPAAQPDAE